MVRYAFDTSFARSLKRFTPLQQLDIKQRVEFFIRALEAHQLPAGFGLTRLAPKLWEIRCGLAQRVLCWRIDDEIRFTFVGNHNEVRRFLKHVR